MNKKTDTAITSLSLDSHKNVPWWNRSVVGEDSLVEDLMGKFGKQEVPESVLLLHSQQMTDLNVFAKTAQAIDNEDFKKQEFLIFVKMHYLLNKGLHQYHGIYESLQLLKIAIDAKHYFISIDQSELRYRGTKQQEIYKFVETLLGNYENVIEFRKQIQTKLADTLPQIKTEEGKTALQNYVQSIDHLSDNELGLKLLSRFKTYQLGDYSVLRVIADFIRTLDQRNLLDLHNLISSVNSNYDLFEKLRNIIGLSQRQSTPETYALMIQFIALYNRHGLVYLKFDNLVKVMQQWSQPYQAIINIRQEHPPSAYKQPKEFKEAIPGVEIYEKYKKLLTEKKTGMVFIDFGDESQFDVPK